MHTTLKISLTTLALALVLPGCKPAATDTATPAEPAVETATPATTPAATPATWPASLNVMGDGFPNAGDPCRKLGESEATVNYLDDTATLAGCLSADDAAKLGGIVVATVEAASAILLEAALSYLGLGVQPPLPSWGLMISEAKAYMFFSFWMIAIPGAALALLVLAINRVGDGLRDVLAPDGRA